MRQCGPKESPIPITSVEELVVMSAHRTLSRPRAATAVSALGLAVVLAGCGASSGTSAATSSTPMTTSATDTALASAGGTAGASGMGGMSGGMASMTYPPVTPGPAATGAHNAADGAFAEGMIPHHGQGVQMADMILAKTGTADVKVLAGRIVAAQGLEIAAMSGWLKGWGRTVPDPYAAMSDGMGGVGGVMMSNTQMQQLDAAQGAAADKVFLTLMPAHHRGAITMAKTELAKGVNPAVRKLAQSIITSQAAEITQMHTMLTAMG
jgi:uncharacterized protein (DUF305 family)